MPNTDPFPAHKVWSDVHVATAPGTTAPGDELRQIGWRRARTKMALLIAGVAFLSVIALGQIGVIAAGVRASRHAARV